MSDAIKQKFKCLDCDYKTIRNWTARKPCPKCGGLMVEAGGLIWPKEDKEV